METARRIPPTLQRQQSSTSTALMVAIAASVLSTYHGCAALPFFGAEEPERPPSSGNSAIGMQEQIAPQQPEHSIPVKRFDAITADGTLVGGRQRRAAVSAFGDDGRNAFDTAAASALIDRNAFRMSFGRRRRANDGGRSAMLPAAMDPNAFRMSFGKRAGFRTAAAQRFQYDPSFYMANGSADFL